MTFYTTPIIPPASNSAGSPSISWYNLVWEPITYVSAPIGDRIRTLNSLYWNQFWFSLDQSLLLVISKEQSAVNCPPFCQDFEVKALTYDTLKGIGNPIGKIDLTTNPNVSRPNSTANLTASIDSIRLDGDRVTISYKRPSNSTNTATFRIR